MTTEQLSKNLLAIINSEMYVNDFGGLQAGRDATTDIHAAMGKLEEALAQPEQREWVGQTDSGHTLKMALLNLEVDANAIFNYPPNETSQNVRNVINWYAASIRTFTSDEVEPLGHMDALRLADEIDPLTRKAHPDNLTMSCAAKVLRILSTPQRQPLTDEDIKAVYEDASGQSLRPQDYRIVLQFARAIEAKLNEKNT